MWGQKSWRQSRERNGAEAADVSSTAKPFDPTQTKPPATQATNLVILILSWKVVLWKTLSNKTDVKFFNSLFKINKVMRAGANILSPITVNLKYPPGTVVDYAYNVFYQVNTAIHFFLILI